MDKITKEIPTDEELLEIIRAALSTALEEEILESFDPSSVDLDTLILRLPLDSLTLMSLMGRLEEETRVFIPDSKAFGFERVVDVTTFLREKLAAKEMR